MSTLATLQKKLETDSTAYQTLQKDYTKAVESRQKLDSQLQENKLVQDEFKVLKDDANIYKLIGPVLVKQDKAEAVTNVDKRIEFIKAEIDRVEKQLKDLQEKTEKKRVELVQTQTALQQLAAQQQKK
ncbi:Prefoldin [Lobosporangium transversale]|uniref:Prefoldin n=1 Tax=Lobosporangium transversale TaxID=64571 RepID=A0A1Y2H4P7_9FUNG|nr:Prefoldin [Lobosporangium transversale]ORZ28002.1 Prefoldin [Lobosporangium transversale]|eukprot:XP_021885705.1 Prefoldin [Lobosporangium transversale]